jgi:manganese oxidase
MPDLASFTMLEGIVKRDRFHPEGATTFNNNLIRPSTHAGLHPQLVAFDVTRHDGMPVGRNRPGGQFAAPGGTTTYQWYAGDIGGQPSNGQVTLVGTPIEFGGANLLPADKIKQGAKSMVGQLVIEPAGSTWSETTQIADRQGGTGKRLTRAQATVTAGTTTFRDFSLVLTKAMTQFYRNGLPVENLNAQGTSIPEDSADSTNMALNYAAEPMWFRFGLLPSVAFGNAGTPGSYGAVPNAHVAYSNTLLSPSVTCGADKICTGDPETPVMFATPGQASRIRITAPHATKRGSTFALHGHVWQRAPYVCPGESRNSLTGQCLMTSVGSRAIGDNLTSFYEAGRDSWAGTTHFDIVLPSSGGAQPVPGDYLARDHGSFGNASGIWSILRVK